MHVEEHVDDETLEDTALGASVLLELREELEEGFQVGVTVYDNRC